MRIATIAIVSLVVATLNAVTPTVAGAGDWTTLGGNSGHDGLSEETGPVAADLLWEGTSSAIFGGPMYIVGDRLVTMRFQSIDVAPIVCHDLETGDQLWSVDFAGTGSRSVPRGVRDGRVYATNFRETQQDSIIALDLETGARLWVSPVRAPLGIVWTVAFAPDGDVITPAAGGDIARIDATTGDEVWTVPRTLPNTGAEAVGVHEGTVYGLEGSITTPKVVTAWDLATGNARDSSPALDGDGDQEMPLTIAPDGTVFIKRDGGPLYALEDDGTEITVRWERPIDAGFFSGHIAVGPDGSVYCPDGTALVRLDPETGQELDRSERLVTSPPLKARMAIDAQGTLYVGNSGSSDGRLYALAPDLATLWSTPVGGMVYGGPALGTGGALAVSGSGTTLKVFRSEATGVLDPASLVAMQLRGAPNPCNGETVAHFALPVSGPVSLTVHDVAGRAVRRLRTAAFMSAGAQTVRWDGRDRTGRPVGSGTYLLRLDAAGASQVAKVRVVR